VKNELLCQWTADATGRRVVAGPVEATATGNVITQAVGAGALESIAAGRELITASNTLVEYEPNPSPAWDDAFARLHQMMEDS
jgi:rhamnulokinase